MIHEEGNDMISIVGRAMWTCAIVSFALPVAAQPAHQHHHDFAAGEPGDPSRPYRTVAVNMVEDANGTMGFSTERLDVKIGEQIRFELKNVGTEPHEFMLDSPEHNEVHKAAMKKNPEMEHDDPNGKTLDPGKSATILWRFSKLGTFEFACLIPSHYELGMRGVVTVSK